MGNIKTARLTAVALAAVAALISPRPGIGQEPDFDLTDIGQGTFLIATDQADVVIPAPILASEAHIEVRSVVARGRGARAQPSEAVGCP